MQSEIPWYDGDEICIADEGTLRRLRKAIALMRRATTEGEFVAASTRVQEIISKYKVSRLQAEEYEIPNIVSEILCDASRMLAWKQILISVLAKVCDCYLVVETLPGRGARKNIYHIYGGSDSVRTTKYLYRMLVSEIERLAGFWWKAVKAEEEYVPDTNGASRKNSFRLGAAYAVARAYLAATEQTFSEPESETALVRRSAEVDLAKEAANRKYGKLKKRPAAATGPADYDAYYAGLKAGNNIPVRQSESQSLGEEE